MKRVFFEIDTEKSISQVSHTLCATRYTYRKNFLRSFHKNANIQISCTIEIICVFILWAMRSLIKQYEVCEKLKESHFSQTWTDCRFLLFLVFSR